MAAESRRVRDLVIEAADAAATLIGQDQVGARWEQPSALEGMTVGALCAHLVRAAGAALAYLDRTDPATRPDGALLTPISYFHAALDAPIHQQIKQVSANEAAVGHHELAAKARAEASLMRTRFAAEPLDRLVSALGGRMLTFDDFCRTRLIEVLFHLDDVAASVGLERPATDPAGPAIVIDILMGIARDRHGDWAVLHTLGRTERAAAGVFPVI
ncbi:MAG: maleylpyruvate isomerase N-terminal domain-containing protein [Acidimicrobiales bacterium]